MGGSEMQLPEFQIVHHTLNEENHIYNIVSRPMGFYKVPNELVIEKTQKRNKIDSDFIIRSREKKNGKHLFFTGIKQTEYQNWFYGDFFEFIEDQKVNSFILFHLSPDQRKLTIHFAIHYKVYPSKREKVIKEYIARIRSVNKTSKLIRDSKDSMK